MNDSNLDNKASLKQKLIVTSMATAMGITVAPVSFAQEAAGIEEIIVTARQRAESSQDVPMTITALSGEDLERQGITTLEDFSRFVSNLNVTTTAPGQNTVIFRGVADAGSFLVDPTAAVYLDEQAMSMTSMAPDIYPVDIARIEALSGPQSTLFGASSQTGTVRVVTNKPDMEGTDISGNMSIGISDVDFGSKGFDFDATANVPLIENKLAARVSVFSAEDGGFIDSVPGMTVVDEYTGLGGLVSNLDVTNPQSDTVEEDINGVEWWGGRVAVKWQISDDWAATLSHNFQEIEANGFNDFDPTVGDLETIKFYDEYRTDDWKNTSLVIEGDLGFAQLTVAGSYYDRETVYQHDTQSYSAYFMYTLGYYAGYATYQFGTDPVGALINDQLNESDTLEVRLSSTGDKYSWTAGIFYMDSYENWDFTSFVDGYANGPAFATWSGYAAYYDITIAPTDTWWHSNQTTTREDKAVFGEVDVKLSDRLSLLLGGRYYEVDRFIGYFVEKPLGYPNNFTPDRTAVDDGFIPKVGFQYDLNDNVMVWSVYSEGYRVGGTNRSRGTPTLPLEYGQDIIENMEFGLKSSWMDDTVQFNATYYHMGWDNMQVELVDPAFRIGEPWQQVVANLGDGTVKGIDVDLKAVVGNVQFGFNMTNIFDAYVNPLTEIPDARFEGGMAPLGLEEKSDLPLFGDLSYSLYTEYAGPINLFGDGTQGFARIQHSYNGESLNTLNESGNAPKLTQGDYRITDIMMGFDVGDWSAQLSLNNITDERGISYRDVSDFDTYYGRYSDNVIRPKNYSISLRRYF